VERFRSAQLNGGAAPSDWLSPMRMAALHRFSELGVPSQKNEDWHFTNLQQLASSQFGVAKVAEPAFSGIELDRMELGKIRWPTMVFVNGRFSPALSSLELLPEGVVVLPLAGVLATRHALAAEYLGTVATFEDQSFTALNTAFMRDGAFVHVPAGLEPELPIRLLYVADKNAADCAIHPRTLIIAGSNSKVSIVESYASTTAAPYFTNAVTEVVLKDGARVNHYKTQNESLAAFHVGTVESRQERNSHLVSFSIASGSRLSRTNIYTLLDGEGCGATLNGLYMVDGDQHVDHQTRITHAQPNCFSREVYKGILDGSSHGVFNGKVYVHPVAQKTDGKQSNNNLLLSEKARVDTKPQLEIFADDVKCTHGATVGRIDEVALFYMKSRGLNARTARELLTYAFAAEVLEEIELEELKLELESTTMKKFTHL
jgi:Fe-S cluster assembly protein SufD